MTNVTDTTTTKLLPLFEQLAEMEPDRCRVDKYDETRSQFDIVIKLGESWFTVWATGINGIASSGLAIVQSVLQKAIAAHGWLYKIENCTSDLNYAQVLISTGVHFIGEAVEPAIALLTAYIAALRAERAAA